MRRFISLLWGVLSHPRQTFEKLSGQPPFGWTVGLLVVLSAVTGLAMLAGADLYEWGLAALAALVLPPAAAVLMLTIYLWLALLTCLWGRLLRGQNGFEGTFCVLVFASVPFLLPSLVSLWLEQSWLTYHLSRVLNLAALVWTTVLLLIGLRISCRFPRWKAWLTALPMLGIFWILSIVSWFGSKPPLEAAYRWQRVEGQRIILYYPKGKSRETIAKTVQMCDRAMDQVCKVLQVKGLDFKVGVFWFPNDKLLKRIVPSNVHGERSHAHYQSVSTSQDTWEGFRADVPHELAHVVIRHRIASNINACALLNEGLATFVQNAVLEAPWHSPQVTTYIPLRTLARRDVFYDHKQAEEISGYTYSHACAFVRYLVKRYGLTKFKRLCEKATGNFWGTGDVSETFAQAIEDVYGIPLVRMEWEWRHAEAPNTLYAFPSWTFNGHTAQDNRFYSSQRSVVKQQGKWKVTLVRAMWEMHLKQPEKNIYLNQGDAIHVFVLIERLDKKPIHKPGERAAGDYVTITGDYGNGPAMEAAEKMILGRRAAPHEILYEAGMYEVPKKLTVEVAQGRWEKCYAAVFRNVPIPATGKTITIHQQQINEDGVKAELVKIGYNPDDYRYLWLVLARNDPNKRVWMPSCYAIDERGKKIIPMSNVDSNDDALSHVSTQVKTNARMMSVHSLAFNPPPANARRLTLHYPLYQWVETERSPAFTFDKLPQPMPK